MPVVLARVESGCQPTAGRIDLEPSLGSVVWVVVNVCWFLIQVWGESVLATRGTQPATAATKQHKIINAGSVRGRPLYLMSALALRVSVDCKRCRSLVVERTHVTFLLDADWSISSHSPAFFCAANVRLNVVGRTRGGGQDR